MCIFFFSVLFPFKLFSFLFLIYYPNFLSWLSMHISCFPLIAVFIPFQKCARLLTMSASRIFQKKRIGFWVINGGYNNNSIFVVTDVLILLICWNKMWNCSSSMKNTFFSWLIIMFNIIHSQAFLFFFSFNNLISQKRSISTYVVIVNKACMELFYMAEIGILLQLGGLSLLYCFGLVHYR